MSDSHVEIGSLARDLRIAPWRLGLLHSAPEHRILWITQGQGRVILNSERRGVGTNNFLFIPAKLPFAFEAGAQTTGHVVRIPGDDPAAWPTSCHLLRTRDVRHQGEVISLFEALSREHSGSREHREEAMAAHLRLISIWLRRQLAHEPQPAEKSSASQRLIAAFLTDLERLYPTGTTMAEYAERLDVTGTHLSRVCKSELGKSAADLITERTLHAARDMLETTGHPAKAIADGLGFGSPAYFSRFIHTHTGLSPKALRTRAAGPVTADRH
jgi:AraC family transcriptional activator of pobA